MFELRLLEIANKQEVDDFIIGLRNPTMGRRRRSSKRGGTLVSLECLMWHLSLENKPKVLELRGQMLELRLLEIANKEEVDKFFIGLPRSYDGKEKPQFKERRNFGELGVLDMASKP